MIKRRPALVNFYFTHRTIMLWLLFSFVVSCGGGNDDPADPTQFEGDIEKFEQQDNKVFPNFGGVVVIGSSSIRLWTSIANDLQPVNIVSRGFGGSTMYGALYYLDRIVLPYKPRAIVIYEGDNDTALGISPETIADDFNKIVAKAKAQNPDIRIYFISIKPSISRWQYWPRMQEANALINAISTNDASVYYIDIASSMFDIDMRPDARLFVNDNLHLNANGYALWTTILQAEMVSIEQAYE